MFTNLNVKYYKLPLVRDKNKINYYIYRLVDSEYLRILRYNIAYLSKIGSSIAKKC